MKKRVVIVAVACWLLMTNTIVQIASADALEEVCADFDSRVQVEDYAQVTSPALNIRNTPGVDAKRLRDPLTPGTLIHVDAGPECVDNYTWWQVTVDGLQGWVAEGNSDVYFLSEPVDPDQIEPVSDGGTRGDVNPNPPLSPLDGRPGGGNYDSACEGIDDNLVASDPATSSYVDSGALVIFTPSLNMLEVDTPAICLGRSYAPNGSEIAIAPNGTRYPPSIMTSYDDEDGAFRYAAVQLPADAFFQFGTWTLQVDGFGLSIDVRAPEHPYVLYTFLDDGMMIVGGLRPHERFIASGTGDEDDTTRYFQAQADSDGSFVIPLRRLPWYDDLPEYDTNSLYASVTRTDIIGQEGSFVTLEGVSVQDPVTEYEWFRIPVREAAPLMQQLIWGGQYSQADAEALLQDWTCPDAAPIRLNRNENESAAAVGNAQRIYSRPSLNSQVREVVQAGDTMFLLGGVECADNGVWWETSDGWLMESQNHQYLWAPA